MIKFGGFRVYIGGIYWGWRMIGIGWRTVWFAGLSINEYLLQRGGK